MLTFKKLHPTSRLYTILAKEVLNLLLMMNCKKGQPLRSSQWNSYCMLHLNFVKGNSSKKGSWN